MKDKFKATSIDAYLNKEEEDTEASGIWYNPLFITIIATILFLIGVFIFFKFRDQDEKVAKAVWDGGTKTTHAIISDKLYIAPTEINTEQYRLLITDRLGETVSANDNKLWGKANKGDSVILYFHHTFGGQVVVTNIKPIQK